MLVLVSDLHITDETAANNVNPEAFGLLGAEIVDAASRAAAADGAARIYVNTGTFLPLISRARDGRTFASAQQMTMVFVYGEDEDTQGKRAGTTSLDIWNGTRRKLYG